jgi:hypothetical protein
MIVDLVGELLAQLEEHVVCEDARDRQVVRARLAHHELHAAHERHVLGVLSRESHLPSIRHDGVNDWDSRENI